MHVGKATVNHSFPLRSFQLKKSLWLLFLAIGTLTIAACSRSLPPLRYRLTVYVDTPSGIRSGSSVIELRPFLSPSFPGPEAGGVRYSVRGEATPVRLPNDNYLFATMRWDKAPELFLEMLIDSYIQMPRQGAEFELNRDKITSDQIEQISRTKAVKNVDPTLYPVFCYFKDIDNPNTIVVVPSRQFILGGNIIKVKNITVQITDDPINNVIEKIIPWLKYSHDGYFDPEIRKPGISGVASNRMLEPMHFKRGG